MGRIWISARQIKASKSDTKTDTFLSTCFQASKTDNVVANPILREVYWGACVPLFRQYSTERHTSEILFSGLAALWSTVRGFAARFFFFFPLFTACQPSSCWEKQDNDCYQLAISTAISFLWLTLIKKTLIFPKRMDKQIVKRQCRARVSSPPPSLSPEACGWPSCSRNSK